MLSPFIVCVSTNKSLIKFIHRTILLFVVFSNYRLSTRCIVSGNSCISLSFRQYITSATRFIKLNRSSYKYIFFEHIIDNAQCTMCGKTRFNMIYIKYSYTLDIYVAYTRLLNVILFLFFKNLNRGANYVRNQTKIILSGMFIGLLFNL